MLFAFWLAQQAAWVVPVVLVVVVLLRWPKRRYQSLRLAVVGVLAVTTGWMLSLPMSVSCSFDGWSPMCVETAGTDHASNDRFLAVTPGVTGRTAAAHLRRPRLPIRAVSLLRWAA